MKKIVLYVIGLMVILWVAMFVTDAKVLVWEESKVYLPWEEEPKKWLCTYFNGRRLIEKSQSYGDSCLNLL